MRGYLVVSNPRIPNNARAAGTGFILFYFILFYFILLFIILLFYYFIKP